MNSQRSDAWPDGGPMPGGPTPARLSVGIISAGRVGTALGEALERAAHVVSGVVAVSDASLARARTRLPQARIAAPDEVAALAELLVIAVPDDELTGLIRGLAATGAVRPGTIVAHTSGSHGVAVLEPLMASGILGLALHPAMTFTGGPEDLQHLGSACFGVTALDEVGYAIAQALVLEMGGEPVRVVEAMRPLYHAALAHGSNHLVTLVADAMATLRVALEGHELLGQELVTDAPGGVPARILRPLLTAALENALRSGTGAMTGPVARGDLGTVTKHLDVLGELDAGLADAYRAIAVRTAQLRGDRTELAQALREREEGADS